MSTAYTYNPIAGSFDIIQTPGGTNSALQFNASGDFSGSPRLAWNNASGILTVSGDLNLDNGGSFQITLQQVTPTANRTISFPDATGTVALIAGSSGQVLYNSSGVNAGLPTLLADASGNLTLSARLTNTFTSLASAPAKTWAGSWFTGGSATTTKPHVLIEPAGTTSTGWGTSGTALGINAASGFAGNLLDLQVNGTSQTRISISGNITTISGNRTSPAYGFNDTVWGGGRIGLFYSNAAIGISTAGGTITGLFVTSSSVVLPRDSNLGWGPVLETEQNIPDLNVTRDTSDVLAQRRGTNAQTFRCYGTFTDASNYVRAALSSTSTAVTLSAQTAGTGADNIPLNLTAAGTGTAKVNSVAEVAVSSTVAALPAAPAVGMITRVTDANAPAVGAIVAGGGAAAALVWYNGTNWRVIGV